MGTCWRAAAPAAVVTGGAVLFAANLPTLWTDLDSLGWLRAYRKDALS